MVYYSNFNRKKLIFSIICNCYCHFKNMHTVRLYTWYGYYNMSLQIQWSGSLGSRISCCFFYHFCWGITISYFYLCVDDRGLTIALHFTECQMMAIWFECFVYQCGWGSCTSIISFSFASLPPTLILFSLLDREFNLIWCANARWKVFFCLKHLFISQSFHCFGRVNESFLEYKSHIWTLILYHLSD